MADQAGHAEPPRRKEKNTKTWIYVSLCGFARDAFDFGFVFIRSEEMRR
jgi:hypothetical protein